MSTTPNPIKSNLGSIPDDKLHGVWISYFPDKNTTMKNARGWGLVLSTTDDAINIVPTAKKNTDIVSINMEVVKGGPSADDSAKFEVGLDKIDALGAESHGRAALPNIKIRQVIEALENSGIMHYKLDNERGMFKTHCPETLTDNILINSSSRPGLRFWIVWALSLIAPFHKEPLAYNPLRKIGVDMLRRTHKEDGKDCYRALEMGVVYLSRLSREGLVALVNSIQEMAQLRTREKY